MSNFVDPGSLQLISRHPSEMEAYRKPLGRDRHVDLFLVHEKTASDTPKTYVEDGSLFYLVQLWWQQPNGLMRVQRNFPMKGDTIKANWIQGGYNGK